MSLLLLVCRDDTFPIDSAAFTLEQLSLLKAGNPPVFELMVFRTVGFGLAVNILGR